MNGIELKIFHHPSAVGGTDVTPHDEEDINPKEVLKRAVEEVDTVESFSGFNPVLDEDDREEEVEPTEEDLKEVEDDPLDEEDTSLKETKIQRKRREASEIVIDIAMSEAVDAGDVIALYLKEVAKVPLLTGPEEVSLAKRIEQGKIAREKLATEKHPDNRSKLQQVARDASDARKHLITANTRLVVSVAKRYMGRGLPLTDLIQEGNIGLMRAVKKFDYRRGHKFSTYATWWIRQAVTRGIADQGRTVRVPVHMGDQINRMLRRKHQLTQRLGGEPSDEQLAAELDIPIKKLMAIKQANTQPLSLELPVGDMSDGDENTVLGDFIQDERAASPHDESEQNLMEEHVAEVLEGLPPRETRILQLRFGLLDGEVHTLEDVGQKMGVTRERVRQVEAQALRRLRHPVIAKKLKEYLG